MSTCQSLEALTTPFTKFRYLGIMSLKSSVMKTLLTNSCDRNNHLENRGGGEIPNILLEKGQEKEKTLFREAP